MVDGRPVYSSKISFASPDVPVDCTRSLIADVGREVIYSGGPAPRSRTTPGQTCPRDPSTAQKYVGWILNTGSQ